MGGFPVSMMHCRRSWTVFVQARYLGRYRNLLNGLIGKEIGGRVVAWLDFNPGIDAEYNIEKPEKIKLPDHEITGLDFLKDEHPDICEQWKSF